MNDAKSKFITWRKIFFSFLGVAMLGGLLENCKYNKTDSYNEKSKTEIYLDSMSKVAEKQKVEKLKSIDVKKLKTHFKTKKDEFSNNNVVWYYPKTAPNFTNQNGVYLYFMTENGVATNLRFVVQYTSDDWLFIQNIKFSINGVAYTYIPDKVERDNGNGGQIWEWFDESANPNKSLLKALISAKNAKMKLVGSQYYKEKTITQEQLKSFRETYDLYLGLGGDF